MDAISAGASVLAFVGVALQSTKNVYQIISGIRTVLREIESLASAVETLQTVLTQLSRCRAFVEPNADLRIITNLIKVCNEDLLRYESYLKKIQFTSNNTKVAQTWKRIKAFLKEKDFQQMWTEVNHHCTVLGLQLNILQSDTSLICKDKIIELNGAVSNRVDHDQGISTLLQLQSADLSIINRNVESVKTSIRNEIHDTVTSLAEKMNQIPKVSEIQTENVCLLLRALQDQVSGLSAQLPSLEGSPQQIPGFSQENNSEPTDHIERLCQLANREEGTTCHEEAEIIINDIEAFLSYHLMRMSDTNACSFASRKRKIADESISCREVKRLRGLILSSHNIDVNKGPPRYSSFKRGRIVQSRKTREIPSARWRTIISINERRVLDLDVSDKLTSPQEMMESSATIKAFLNHSESPTVLVVHLRQIQVDSGYSFLNPTLSVGKTLADDSPIFDIVKRGDVEQLQSLLAQKEGTLRDRDSYGTPLLQYAMRQPTMCKFLIENGADIDDLARDPDLRQFFATPLQVEVNETEEDNEARSRIVECRHLVLEAGADPTVADPDAGPTSTAVGEAAAGSGSVQSLQLILEIAGFFVDLKQQNESGETLLHRLAYNFNNGYDPQRFELLIRGGANIHARDNEGKTCLRVCIESARFLDRDEQESLILLIRIGADVASIDHQGISISDIAYSRSTKDEIYDTGGYRGDLWDAVLFQCGYDISKTRLGYPRRPQYTRRYTRKHFERLWDGLEQFCPYYDDPFEWCPHRVLLNEEASERILIEDREQRMEDISEDEQFYEIETLEVEEEHE